MSISYDALVGWVVVVLALVVAGLDAAIAATATHQGWIIFFAVLAGISLVFALGIGGSRVGWATFRNHVTGALGAPRTRSSGPAWSEIEVEETGIRARKTARLCVDEDAVLFSARSGRGSYGVAADARCDSPTIDTEMPVPLSRDRLIRRLEGLFGAFAHEAPGAQCTCGFYAKVGDIDPPFVGDVLLEVQLTGRILASGEWRRGEHQRVISFAIPRRCAAAKLTLPEGLGSGELDGSLICGDEAIGLRVAGESVLPVCEQHASQSLMSPADVGRSVGVIAHWLRDAPAPVRSPSA